MGILIIFKYKTAYNKVFNVLRSCRLIKKCPIILISQFTVRTKQSADGGSLEITLSVPLNLFLLKIVSKYG